MAFRLIHIEYLPGLLRQGRINLYKPVCYIFMYRTLGHPERLGRLPHRGIGLDDIIGDINGSLFNIFFTMYEGLQGGMTYVLNYLGL